MYNPRTLQGDPTRGTIVSEYMGFIRMEQGLSGVLLNLAGTMTKRKMDKFMNSMGLDIEGRRGLGISTLYRYARPPGPILGGETIQVDFC